MPPLSVVSNEVCPTPRDWRMQDQLNSQDCNHLARDLEVASTSSRTCTSSDREDAASEVYVLGRAFTDWGGGVFNKMSPAMREAVLNMGLCHYMVAIKKPCGRVVQYDFGPIGGDVSASKAKGGAPAEVRETHLKDGIPSGEPVLFVGQTMMDLEHVREFNKGAPSHYSLYVSDCRHYANGLVKHLTGNERCTAQYLRHRYNQHMTADGDAWHKGFYEFSQAIADIENWREKAARDRLLQEQLTAAVGPLIAVSGGSLVAAHRGIFFGLASRMTSRLPTLQIQSLGLPNRAAVSGSLRAVSSRLAAAVASSGTASAAAGTKHLLLYHLLPLPCVAQLASRREPGFNRYSDCGVDVLERKESDVIGGITKGWVPLSAGEMLPLARAITTATQVLPWANITRCISYDNSMVANMVANMDTPKPSPEELTNPDPDTNTTLQKLPVFNFFSLVRPGSSPGAVSASSETPVPTRSQKLVKLGGQQVLKPQVKPAEQQQQQAEIGGVKSNVLPLPKWLSAAWKPALPASSSSAPAAHPPAVKPQSTSGSESKPMSPPRKLFTHRPVEAAAVAATSTATSTPAVVTPGSQPWGPVGALHRRLTKAPPVNTGTLALREAPTAQPCANLSTPVPSSSSSVPDAGARRHSFQWPWVSRPSALDTTSLSSGPQLIQNITPSPSSVSSCGMKLDQPVPQKASRTTLALPPWLQSVRGGSGAAATKMEAWSTSSHAQPEIQSPAQGPAQRSLGKVARFLAVRL